MSIFATIAVVCTLATCSDYVIDTASNQVDASINTQAHNTKFLSVWEDEKQLTNWLSQYSIGETVFEIVSLELETKEVKEDDTP
jgi:hypothetical protein